MIVMNSRFDRSTVDAVWKKGTVIQNCDPALWRLDAFGAVIHRDQYGQRDKEYGWEVDHIHPVIKGGSDMLSNLRPLYYRNNLARNTDGPLWAFYRYNPSSQYNNQGVVSLRN